MSKKYFNRKLDKIADEANFLTQVKSVVPFDTREDLDVIAEIDRLIEWKHKAFFDIMDKIG